jgi:hypothetical protein
VIIAGAATAAAIALRKRTTPSATPADEADTGEIPPVTGQPAPSSNADAARAARTS